MVWPTGQQATTDNLDSSTDNPSFARIDLYNALVMLNAMIASQNTGNGAVVTDAFNKILSDQIPNNIDIVGNLNLRPTSNRVGIRNLLNIEPKTAAEIALVELPQVGDIMIASDGDAGNPAVCFYTGTEWRYLAFSSLTAL